MADEKKKTCDCGCEHDDGCCDDGCCDMDEGVIMLTDEDGNEIPFYHIATLERDGKEYACLQKADEEDPVVEIFELTEAEEDGEEFFELAPIDDELYESLYDQLEKEVAEIGDGCDDPDCECHHHHDDDND